jgi:hypothetical protein
MNYVTIYHKLRFLSVQVTREDVIYPSEGAIYPSEGATCRPEGAICPPAEDDLGVPLRSIVQILQFRSG